jgi:electron transfer flavoprotein-quinone oxidoreductase
MTSPRYDVLVVGAGAAGLSAAIGLARAGFAVAVLEAAVAPGAENWSGCVYFCETLAHPDLLGPDGVATLAWERRLVERGLFATDGQGLLGLTYRDPEAFRHCYTVLRPIFDGHLAQLAGAHGATLLTGTTVESLIRDGDRVIGVCTNRGPFYADLVFLAEGDAGHLVRREGYERSSDPRDAPRFLLGIKQVYELPAEAIEDRFGLGAEDGIAYDLLVRNGTLHGRKLRLNLHGFVCTNRQSLSVGLLVPLDGLSGQWGGDPNLLMEWFADLPVLRPWLRDGRPGVFGAKLIRRGEPRDVPQLVDDGLAIGGAAGGMGATFPFLNITGPATATGLRLARAAVSIRAAGGRFTRDDLRRHYLEPLHQAHFWQDMTFLRRWPGYVRSSPLLFDRSLDLALGTAYLWTRRDHWFPTRWFNWLNLLWRRAGPWHWPDMRDDVYRLLRALRWREVVKRPPWERLLFDGAVNALRDLLRRPRVNLPTGGEVRLRYTIAGEAAGGPRPLLRRWFRRFTGVLAPVLRRAWGNDDIPLSIKLPDANRLLFQQINVLDLAAAGAVALAVVLSAIPFAFWYALRGLCRPRRLGPYPGYVQKSRRASDLTSAVHAAREHRESRLAAIAYQPSTSSHIHVLGPRTLPDDAAILREGLAQVCPAGVFEVEPVPGSQVRLRVHSERCINCEACWRASNRVDWARDGRHHFVYPVQSPAAARMLETNDPAEAEPLDSRDSTGREPTCHTGGGSGPLVLLDRLDRKLAEFDAALAEEPRTVDRARGDYLEMLARYARQLAAQFLETVRGEGGGTPGWGHRQRVLHLATNLAAKAEERARRAWEQRFAWAAADGRQMRQHHLVALRRLLEGFDQRPGDGAQGPTAFWLGAEHDGENSLVGMADCLCRWAVDAAGRRVLLSGRFQDEDGRDTVCKFGAVKRLLAEMAADRYLIDTLGHDLPPGDCDTSARERPLLIRAAAADALHRISCDMDRLFHVTGSPNADAPVQRCRAAAAAGPLASPANAVVYLRRGERLLHGGPADSRRLMTLPDEKKLFEQITQRRAVHAELEELRGLQARLNQLLEAARQAAPHPPPTHAEIAEALARQEAALLAGKALLLRTHARLEHGLDSEIETALLRVWLESAAVALGGCEETVRQRLTPERRADRPVVEPAAGPPLATFAEYLHTPDRYESGDYLALPVDLLRPRLVPEIADPACSMSIPDALTTGRAGRLIATANRICEEIERSRAAAEAPAGTVAATVAWRLQRMEEACFAAEAVAHETAGLLQHPRQQGLRLELAAARVFLSDMLHRVLSISTEIRSLAIAPAMELDLGSDAVAASCQLAGSAQSPARKRAACGYELLILRQLLVELVPRWASSADGARPYHLGREALELEALTTEFRRLATRAVELFGDGLWQDPNMQATGGLLADAAVWLKAADSSLGRLAWWGRRGLLEEDGNPSPRMALARRVLDWCGWEARGRLRRFEADLADLRRGYHTPQIRAATLYLRRAGRM